MESEPKARLQAIRQQHYRVTETELRNFILLMIQEAKKLADRADLPGAAHHLQAAANEIGAIHKKH